MDRIVNVQNGPVAIGAVITGGYSGASGTVFSVVGDQIEVDFLTSARFTAGEPFTTDTGTSGFIAVPTTFVVEDGAGRPTANSYTTVEFADAYAANLGAGPEWTAALLMRKQELLRLATAWIDWQYGLRFMGRRSNERQGLRWPRNFIFDVDGFPIAQNNMPIALQQATVEAALFASKNPGALMPNVQVADAQIKSQRVQLGPMQRETQYQTAKPTQPILMRVQAILSGAGLIQSGNYVQR